VACSMVLLISAAFVDSPYYYVAVMLTYSISNGFVYPTSISGATAVDPRIAGAASAFMGFIQLITGTVASAAAGSFAGADPWSLIAVCVICGLLTPVFLLLIPKAKA
jgi:DHA1 family bicyclomycin/chloramphenicol resistance-like MFS transporter